jgi:hypothetical protein
MAKSTVVTLSVSDEEAITVPVGGYIANQFIQTPSGRAGWVDYPAAFTAGQTCRARTSGIVQLPMASALLGILGQRVWWDATGDTLVTSAPAVGWYAGTLVVAKIDAVLTGSVLLNALPKATDRVLTKTADYTLTAIDCTGAICSNVGAAGTTVWSLPAALPGMSILARVGVAQQLRLEPIGSETISLPSTGVPGAAGKYLVADVIGETVWLICVVAGTWSVFGYTGTWTAEA